MSYCCSHATHLAIFALGQRQSNPRVGNGLAHADRDRSRRKLRGYLQEFGYRRPGASILEVDSTRQATQRLARRNAFDLDEIRTKMAYRGVGELAKKSVRTRQQEKALAVAVEATGRVHVRHGDMISESVATIAIGERSKTVVGLPET